MNYLWQGRKDSNSQQTVLETAALPIELHPYIGIIIMADFMKKSLAEGTGFEPAEVLPSPVFETGALNQTRPPLHVLFCLCVI